MKTTSSKSQISLEFMIILGFLVLLLVVFLSLFTEQQQDALEQGEFLTLKSECIRLASAISGVYVSGDGTAVRTWTGEDISAGDNLVQIGEVSCSYSAKLSPVVITGNVAVKNKGGTVFLESY